MNKDLTPHHDHEAQILADLHAAHAGVETALKHLRTGIKGPEPDEFMQFYGIVRDQVETNLLAVIDGKPGFQAISHEKVARLRNHLGWESVSEMERLLIDAVDIAWLDYYLAHLKFNQVQSAATTLQDHYQKRLDRAHNRFLTSIKTLATVRKMALPTLIALKADIHVTNRRRSSRLKLAGPIWPGEIRSSTARDTPTRQNSLHYDAAAVRRNRYS